MADTVDTVVNELIINKLTQAQYDALTEKSPTELYFVTDAKEPLQVIDSVENFPACTVEDLGKLVLYTGPTTNSTEESIQLILDSKIINGHIFGVVEQTIAISETESETIYMWKDVYESLPTIEDSVTGKVLSNNGLYPEWVDMQSGISEIIHDTTLSGSGTAESPLKVADDTYLPLSGGEVNGRIGFYAMDTEAGLLFRERVGTNYGTKIYGSQPYCLTVDLGILKNGYIYFGNYGGFSSTKLPLGDPTNPWKLAYIEKLNNGADIAVPTEGGTLARVEDINAIGGDGTAGQVLTKTDNGMAWQDAAGGSSLPDQTGNTGKFLQTNGTEASWSNNLYIGTDYLSDNNVYIGSGIGEEAPKDYGVVNIGANSSARGLLSVAIGFQAQTSGEQAVQIGQGANNDNNTFKVANANGNFEMMDANGNVPLERLTYVTNQIGDISTALTAILGE